MLELNHDNYFSKEADIIKRKRNARFKDLTDQRFGKLVAKEYVPTRNSKGIIVSKWKCLCDCGNYKMVRSTHLMQGAVASCGCIKKAGVRTTHGLSKTRFHAIWSNMKSRATNEHCSMAERYVLRGITICEEWKNFDNFKNDMYERYIEHIKKYGKKNTSIDRIDNDKGYYIDNCRWATLEEQALNKSTNTFYDVLGERLSLTQIAKKYNLPVKTVHSRIQSHWDMKDVIKKAEKRGKDARC